MSKTLNLHTGADTPHFQDLGEQSYSLAAALYPICRSITGDGVRETLSIMRRHVDIKTQEIATGTPILDWTVPKEWNIRGAYIKDAAGRTVVDFASSSLHVMSYSVPICRTMSLDELRPHLHTLPDHPNVIPYRTSYWSETWGFCLPHRELLEMGPGPYQVVIDSTLQPGAMTYGEYVHKGALRDEFVLTSHICHPSLANDNCSGLAALTVLAKLLSRYRTRLTYRFIFSPGTIGPIAWLSRNEHRLCDIRHGLVVAGIGDDAQPTYKRSRKSEAGIDRMAAHVLATSYTSASVLDFEPYGYDERQFCSPGYDLPFGLLQRGKFGTFPEYHTSADDLHFISAANIADSLSTIWRIIEIAETDFTPLNLSPKGEPQLGRRGLYASTGGDKNGPDRIMAMLWVLNQADGTRTLLDIAERAKLPYRSVKAAATALSDSGLIVDRKDTASIDGAASWPQST